MTQALYGPGSNCCPSMLRKTTYVWNGTSLAVQTVKTEEPGGRWQDDASRYALAPIERTHWRAPLGMHWSG
jgi:hypothetical protein